MLSQASVYPGKEGWQRRVTYIVTVGGGCGETKAEAEIMKV